MNLQLFLASAVKRFGLLVLASAALALGTVAQACDSPQHKASAHARTSQSVTVANQGAKPVTSPKLQAHIQFAMADAAKRSNLAASRLKLELAEAVTWPDASIGCPREGMMVAQALTPGYRVRIKAGDKVLNYHASENGQASFCPSERAVEPLPRET